MKVVLTLAVALLATSAMAQPAAKRQITPPVHLAPFSAMEAIPSSSTAPTIQRFKFTLPAGGTSALIAIPKNLPVKLMVAQTTTGFRAVGEATVLRPTPSAFIQWVGYDYATKAFSEGFTSSPGTHMIWADFSEDVDVQVADADHIQVKNNNSSAQAIYLDLIY